jgi:hypothetical protein
VWRTIKVGQATEGGRAVLGGVQFVGVVSMSETRRSELLEVISASIFIPDICSGNREPKKEPKIEFLAEQIVNLGFR